jgi:transcriptional antiterminator RfaH
MFEGEGGVSGAGAGAGSELHLAWFCVRSQPKHEHIAAANLRQQQQTEVFNPRIRFKRATRRGPIWVTESLFPNYVFARFNWKQTLRLVHHTPGVAGVVHFGMRWPTIPDAVIGELRAAVGEEELRVLGETLEAGDEVQISGGAFHGLQGVVTRVMPARARVAVLLEFLGRQSTVEVERNAVVRLHPGVLPPQPPGPANPVA